MAREVSDMAIVLPVDICSEMLVNDVDQRWDLFTIELMIPTVLLGSDLQALLNRHRSRMQAEPEFVRDIGAARNTI